MRVNFITTRNTHNGYGMARDYLMKYLPTVGLKLDPPGSGNNIDLIFHIPTAVAHSKAPVKVLYTMLEGDTVPDSWLPFLKMATHVLVPSNFVRQTFLRAGVESTVVPLGYDPDIFAPVVRKPGPVYRFLHYEAFQDRKGWEDVLEAFLLSGLAEEENECQLTLKSIVPMQKVYDKLDGLFIPNNVKIVLGELPHHCIFDLLCESDCLVFPSHGEGFSLPPIEAMATGCPTILSIGHSHLDYYNEDYMYGVPCDIKIPARYDNWEDQGSFVRCNVDELAKTMRHVYDHRDEARIKGERSVEYISRYDYIECVRKLFSFLESV